MTNTLLVNEIFGPAIQGEGPAAGRRCTFVRLSICPLHCTWCDTPYTWTYTDALALKHQSHLKYDKAKEIHEMTVKDIVKHVLNSTADSRLVILSGGEPLAQVPVRYQTGDVAEPAHDDDPVGELVRELSLRGIAVHIETAGIRLPSGFLHRYVDKYVVSPKLDSSGNALSSRCKDKVLKFFASTAKANFKFVITKPEDFSEVQHLANVYNIPPQYIWCMPEGTTSEAIQSKSLMVVEGALIRGYNYSDRLHVRLWGDRRGY